MKKLHLLAIVALIIVGLSGCEKAKVANDAAADVFVKSIINAQGATVYTAIHSVFSYNTMTSVLAQTPAGPSVQLTNFENGGKSFFNEPVDADYSATPPVAGTYTYKVKFEDGEEKTFTNALSSSTILPATITSLAKNASGDSIYISWNAIATTHFYQLKVMKGTTLAFYQPGLQDISNPQKTNLRFGFPTSTFANTGSGTYTFELTGLLFETTANDYIQAISTATKDIEL